MIDVIDIRDIGKRKYDAPVEFIVNSLRATKGQAPKGSVHILDLAPSGPLVGKYIELKQNGQWYADTFRDIYLPWFLRDLERNPKAQQALQDLYDADKAGKNIAIACFCKDEALCHRSIIAGILSYYGANVHTKHNIREYEIYGPMYKGTLQTGKENQQQKTEQTQPIAQKTNETAVTTEGTSYPISICNITSEEFRETIKTPGNFDVVFNIDPNIHEKGIVDLKPLMPNPESVQKTIDEAKQITSQEDTADYNNFFRGRIAPQFMAQIHARNPERVGDTTIRTDNESDAQDWLRILMKASKQGKHIALVSNQPVGQANTTSIIAGLLAGAGTQVITQDVDLKHGSKIDDAVKEYYDAYRFAYGTPDFATSEDKQKNRQLPQTDIIVQTPSDTEDSLGS